MNDTQCMFLHSHQAKHISPAKPLWGPIEHGQNRRLLTSIDSSHTSPKFCFATLNSVAIYIYIVAYFEAWYEIITYNLKVFNNQSWEMPIMLLWLVLLVQSQTHWFNFILSNLCLISKYMYCSSQVKTLTSPHTVT